MVQAKITAGIEAASEADELVPLTKVRFPGSPHAVTLWRWKSRGVNRNGRRVKLKTVACGARVFCCQKWADEFIRECNADDPATEPATDFARRAAEENRALAAILG